jgi:hypothetical protein
MTSDPIRWWPSLKDYDLGSLNSLPYQMISAFREVELAVDQIARSM